MWKRINSSINGPTFLKGMAMGVADIVPGVSGGTVALLLGIYQKFIGHLSEIKLRWLIEFVSFQWGQLWKDQAFRFLGTLGLGILSAILVGAQVISLAFDYYPEIVWSVFLGLVLASIFILLKRERKKIMSWVFLMGGASFAFILTQVAGLDLGSGSGALFISGFFAICAMLLPGISGSYILVILGQYQGVLLLLKDPFHLENLGSLGIFLGGLITGLLLGSRFIKWLLLSYEHLTIMTMIGFMIGALGNLWPWKNLAFSGSFYDSSIIIYGMMSFIFVLFLELKGQKKSIGT